MSDEIRAVSVVIPTWNGLGFLATCLDALRRQSFQDFKVILVDNGSADGSQEFVRQQYPEVQLVALDCNYGFSEAVNRGIAATQSRLVALLNNDTEPDPDWLAHCVQALHSRPDIGYAACQMLDFFNRDRLDSAGDTMTRTGLPLKRGMDQPAAGRLLESREVMGASAGAAVYRREVLEQVGAFDPGYFMYLEDVDWCLRAALLGIRCLYVPEAKVYHIEGGSDPRRQGLVESGDTRRRGFHTPERTYWITRNRVRLLLKNYPLALLIRDFPWILVGFLRSALFHMFRSGLFPAYVRGLWCGIKEIPQCWALRRDIQKSKKITVQQFAKILFEQD